MSDPEQDYFVDGMTESLTTDLSRIAGSSSDNPLYRAARARLCNGLRWPGCRSDKLTGVLVDSAAAASGAGDRTPMPPDTINPPTGLAIAGRTWADMLGWPTA
jgi:hypothetical protein